MSRVTRLRARCGPPLGEGLQGAVITRVLAQTVQTAGFTAVVSERVRTVRYAASAEAVCDAAQAASLAALAPSRQGWGYAIPGACVITCGRKR